MTSRRIRRRDCHFKSVCDHNCNWIQPNFRRQLSCNTEKPPIFSCEKPRACSSLYAWGKKVNKKTLYR